MNRKCQKCIAGSVFLIIASILRLSVDGNKIIRLAGSTHSTYLKVHKREKFFSSDFEFFTILYLVKL